MRHLHELRSYHCSWYCQRACSSDIPYLPGLVNECGFRDYLCLGGCGGWGRGGGGGRGLKMYDIM